MIPSRGGGRQARGKWIESGQIIATQPRRGGGRGGGITIHKKLVDIIVTGSDLEVKVFSVLIFKLSIDFLEKLTRTVKNLLSHLATF